MESRSMEAQIASLRATVEAGFQHLDQRADALVDGQKEIAREVRMTNGRVTRAEEHIKTLFHQGEELIKQLQHRIRWSPPGDGSAPEAVRSQEDRKVTTREVVIATISIGGTVSVLKFLEWFAQLRGTP